MDKMLQRLQTYILFSRLFNDQTKKDDLHSYQEFIRSFDGGEIMQSLEKVFDTWLADKEIEDKLQKEYASLFLLPGGVKPYSSFYLGDEPLLMQQPWVDIKKFYQQCGWQLEQKEKHPEDHAAVVLAFMAHLISSDDDEMQEVFYIQHINTWMPSFFRDLQDNKYAYFYREVAAYGLRFLEEEQKLHAGISEEI